MTSSTNGAANQSYESLPALQAALTQHLADIAEFGRQTIAALGQETSPAMTTWLKLLADCLQSAGDDGLDYC